MSAVAGSEGLLPHVVLDLAQTAEFERRPLILSRGEGSTSGTRTGPAGRRQGADVGLRDAVGDGDAAIERIRQLGLLVSIDFGLPTEVLAAVMRAVRAQPLLSIGPGRAPGTACASPRP